MYVALIISAVSLARITTLIYCASPRALQIISRGKVTTVYEIEESQL